MQIKNSFDKTTLCKIGTSFLISLVAGLGAAFIGFSKEFVEFLMSEGKDLINWYVVGLAFWLPFSSAIVASFYQWKKGTDLPKE
jgi:hypothetical protein